VDYRGHPAIMIKEAVKDLQAAATPVGSVVIIGIGYNSLWQRNRANYSAWANEFDAEAENLITVLKQLGAKTLVWVTLREPSASVVPPLGKAQYDAYVWYFPYVNEQLHILQQRHPDLLLADWAAISNRPGVTYDAIHLNTAGAQLMINLIRSFAPGGAAGGAESCDDACDRAGRQHQKELTRRGGKRTDPPRGRRGPDEGPAEKDTEPETSYRAEDGDDDRLPPHHRPHLTSGLADRSQQAKLADPLVDGEREGVGDTHERDHDGKGQHDVDKA